MTPEEFRARLTPEDLVDIEAGEILPETLRAYAESMARRTCLPASTLISKKYVDGIATVTSATLAIGKEKNEAGTVAPVATVDVANPTDHFFTEPAMALSIQDAASHVRQGKVA
jgi:hypothetical protein